MSEYEAVLDEYLEIYEAEERRCNGVVVQAPVKRQVWERGSFWYFHAVSVPKGMYNIFDRHIQPLFNKDHPEQAIFDEVFFWYWGFGAQETIDKKLRDKEDYLVRVREAFGGAAEQESTPRMVKGGDIREETPFTPQSGST